MIFKTTAELKEYLTFASDFDFADLKPHIASAEKTELIPFLSQVQYDALQTAYDANSTDPDHLKLLDAARMPVAHHSMFLYSYFGDKNIGKSGINVVENGELKMASQWRIEDLREFCKSQKDQGIESMLAFLEANKTIYTGWAASNSYTVYKESFINTATEFSALFNINNSRRTFLALKGIMKRVEDISIKSITGVAMFDALKTEITAGSVSANNQKLLDLIRPCVACFTGQRACVELALNVENGGLTVMSTSTTLTQVARTPAPDPIISMRMDQAEKDGALYREKLRKFLYDNHADYSEYESDSSVYVSSPTTDINTAGNGLYSTM